MTAARNSKGCSIRIEVLGDTYRKRLKIYMPTPIIGEKGQNIILSGTIENLHHHTLRLENIAIVGAQDFGIL